MRWGTSHDKIISQVRHSTGLNNKSGFISFRSDFLLRYSIEGRTSSRAVRPRSLSLWSVVIQIWSRIDGDSSLDSLPELRFGCHSIAVTAIENREVGAGRLLAQHANVNPGRIIICLRASEWAVRSDAHVFVRLSLCPCSFSTY